MEQFLKRFLRRNLRSENRWISMTFKGAFHFAKSVKKILFFPQKLYDIWIAKWIAKYLFFFYWPLYKILDLFRVRFIMNISPGVGHTIPEFDNVLHQFASKELDPSKKYVLVLKNSYYYREFLDLYKNRFGFTSTSTLLYDFLLPMLMHYKSLSIDAGLSRLKWHFPQKDEEGVITKGRPYVFQYPTKKGILQSRHYYERRMRAPNYLPLSQPLGSSEELIQKLGLKRKKLCAVHIKTDSMNATALPTDPKTYLKTLEFLQNNGFTFVFVGREKMPPCFQSFDMVDYATSKWASFKNDILFFQAIDMAIVTGSGISYLADCINKPLLYVNHWHNALPPFTQKSIFIPTLVDQKDGSPLSFSQQFELYLKTSTEYELFPSENYLAKNASEEEIFQGAKELLQLNDHPSKALTELQEKFKKIDREKGWLSVSLSRPSQFFLETHQERFEVQNEKSFALI